MKLQVVLDMEDRHPIIRYLLNLGRDPDEIIGLAPFRDKLIIVTRDKLLMLEHNEETEVKIIELVKRHANDIWLET